MPQVPLRAILVVVIHEPHEPTVASATTHSISKMHRRCTF